MMAETTQIGDCTLIHGDCLEIMPTLEPGSVDLVLTDPPYGTTHNRWDSVIPFEGMWKGIHRLSNETTPVVLFSQMPFGASLICSNPQEFRYEWIWHKNNPTGFLNANRMPMRAHENVLVFYKRLPLYNPQKSPGKPYRPGTVSRESVNYGKFDGAQRKEYPDGSRFPTDVIKYSNCSDRSGGHPTQKPVDLLRYLIRTYTNPGDTVLDFTMGSGSTGVACVEEGRKFIGIELDDHYYDIACKRVLNACQTSQNAAG